MRGPRMVEVNEQFLNAELELARSYRAKAKDADERTKQLVSMRAVLMVYLKIKVEAEDWHAVSDAANDLREVDAELRAMKPA